MTSSSRRALLASALPAVVATAGCLDASGGDTGRDDTATGSTDGGETTDGTADEDAPPATTHDVDGRTVRFVSARTARAIVTLLSSTHPSVTADADRQYVVVELAVSGDDAQSVAKDACELRVDDDAVQPVPERVQPFTDSVHLAFALGLDVDPGDVSLAWHGEAKTVVFPVPGSVTTSLVAPPAFEVRSFDVPNTEGGDRISVSFTVANVGESDGEFLAELGSTAISDQGELRVSVVAGETKTVTESVAIYPDAGDQTVVLDWGSGKLERTVQVPTTTE